MTTPAPSTYNFRVTSVVDTGNDVYTIQFAHVGNDNNAVINLPPHVPALPAYGNNISLSLTREQARTYFPGDIYTVSFAPAPATPEA